MVAVPKHATWVETIVEKEFLVLKRARGNQEDRGDAHKPLVGQHVHGALTLQLLGGVVCGVVRCGVVWCGGVVRCGVVWWGVVVWCVVWWWCVVYVGEVRMQKLS